MKLSLLLLTLAALSSAWVNATPVPEGEDMERPPVGVVEQRDSKQEMKIDLEEIAVEINSLDDTVAIEDMDTLIKLYHLKKAANDEKENFTVEKFEEDQKDRSRRHIFSDDERLPVIPDYPRNPYCAVGQLDNGCTATLIGPYHAITAARCVYNRVTRTWRRSEINFRRGRNCGRSGTRMYWTNVHALQGYTVQGLAQYDFALIVFRRTSPSPCHMGFGFQGTWSGRGLDVIGYHTDKPREVLRCSYNRMYSSSCHFSRTAHSDLSLVYRADAEGASGGPLISETTSTTAPLGTRAVYGVNAYEDRARNWNFGPRLTRSRFYQIVQWMRASGHDPL